MRKFILNLLNKIMRKDIINEFETFLNTLMVSKSLEEKDVKYIKHNKTLFYVYEILVDKQLKLEINISKYNKNMYINAFSLDTDLVILDKCSNKLNIPKHKYILDINQLKILYVVYYLKLNEEELFKLKQLLIEVL